MYRKVGYIVGAVTGWFAVAYGYQSQYLQSGNEDVQVLKAVRAQDLQTKTENEGGVFPVSSSVRTAVNEKQKISINDAIVKARELACRRKDEVGAPGIVIGVSINGKTVWEEGKHNVFICTSVLVTGTIAYYS
jgi:imidazole glycerol phosphate synthase subunit HisF